MAITLTEEVAIRSAPKKRPSRKQVKLAREFDVDIARLSKQFARDIIKVLNEFGKDLEKATLKIIDREKDIAEDAVQAGLIAEEVNIAGFEVQMAQVYEKNYKRIMRATEKRTSATMDLAISITDDTEAQILSGITDRIGLMDINKKTTRKIFQELGKGRGEGESVVQLARRIRDFVPAGRFKKVSTRAQLIARTEATHAQKMAAAASYSENGVEEVMIMDNRLGTADMATDPECIQLVGKVVSIQDGVSLMDEEHPNGTRRMVAMPPPVEE
jgi:hypothetical protein